MSASRASEPRPTGRRPALDGNDDRRRGDASRPGAIARGESLMRAGELPCVWMTAGLIAWRLCDRDLDCEHCELDAALGRDAGHVAGGATARRGGRGRLAFPCDRRYAPGHGWVQEVEPGVVRVGVDALLARLLDRTTAAVLPAPGSHARRGQPLCWLLDDGVPVPLAAPLSGTLLRINAEAQEEPTRVLHAPYGEGWLLELATAPEDEAGAGLVDAATQRGVTARHLRELRRRAARHARRPRCAALGPTSCDGGRPARGLRELLGSAAYHRLLCRLTG